MPWGLVDVVGIAAGEWHSLALRHDGTVIAWGNNAYGQTNVPPGLTNVVAIAAGYYHNLALKADGTVVAWGAGTSIANGWEIGSIEWGQSLVPAGFRNVTAVAGGSTFSLALVGDRPPVLSAPLATPNWDANGFSVSLPTQSGRVYRLEYKSSLAEDNWTALPLVAGNGGVRTLTDATATGAQRFYCVRQW